MKIKSRFDHFNFNVTDLEKSIAFYEQALGLQEVRRKEAGDGSFILVYCYCYSSRRRLGDHPQKYDLGECEFHLCMRLAGDYDGNREYHREMGCICYENHDMGLYFISDPDGYWIEILRIK